MGCPEDLKRKIEENFEDEIKTLQELIAIESPVAEAVDDMPFGRGVQQAFEYMLGKGEAFGFETENIDNYGGHIDIGGYEYDEDGEMTGMVDETMGIICHLDTVPLGSEWTREPLGGEIDGGRMYGRGASDDKGPAVASLYAMKAVSDLGIRMDKRVRLIFGLDEETDWIGMERYQEETELPDFGFTPDADFPAINGEMGIMAFDIAKKFGRFGGEGLALKSIKGGEAYNMVADSARAVVSHKNKKAYEKITAAAEEWNGTEGITLTVKPTGKSLEIRTKGISAHGAHPEAGKNAISGLLDFLGTLTFVNEDMNDFIAFYNEHIGFELDGRKAGCRFEDDISGHTVLNAGVIELDSKSVRLTVNIRYPISCSDEKIYEALDPVCREYDLGIVKGKHEKPIFIPADDSFIKTLMDIYREHTGDEDCRPKVIGGGTYARAFKNVVAFGARFPDEEDVAHQRDEYIDIERLKMITEIYADAIYRLACGEPAQRQELEDNREPAVIQESENSQEPSGLQSQEPKKIQEPENHQEQEEQHGV